MHEQMRTMSNNNYISLQEASEYTPFDSNYLGLLIRKGWLFGIKKKGKWYTTQKAVEQYMKNFARIKVAEKKSPVKSFLTQAGMGSFFFIALLAFVAVSNAFFFEEGKREVAQMPVERAWSADGKSAVIVSEGAEASSLMARR
jgi:hypothetical protein